MSAEATAYVIDPTHSGPVAERIIGADYTGVMIHDGWSPYDNFLLDVYSQSAPKSKSSALCD